MIKKINHENFKANEPEHGRQSIDFGDGSYVSGRWKDDPATNEAVRAIAKAGLELLRQKAKESDYRLQKSLKRYRRFPSP
jgi:hypothetical protein